jgi:hypothetical protein
MHKFFKASFNQAKGSYYDFKKTNSSVHDSAIKNNENYRSERGNYNRLPLAHEDEFDTFNNYSSTKKSAKPSVRRNMKPAVKLNKSKSPLQVSNRLKNEYDHMPRYIVDNENYNRSEQIEEDYNRENEDGFMGDENNSPLPEIVKVHQDPIAANSKQDSERNFGESDLRKNGPPKKSQRSRVERPSEASANHKRSKGSAYDNGSNENPRERSRSPETIITAK